MALSKEAAELLGGLEQVEIAEWSDPRELSERSVQAMEQKQSEKSVSAVPQPREEQASHEHTSRSRR